MVVRRTTEEASASTSGPLAAWSFEYKLQHLLVIRYLGSPGARFATSSTSPASYGCRRETMDEVCRSDALAGGLPTIGASSRGEKPRAVSIPTPTGYRPQATTVGRSRCTLPWLRAFQDGPGHNRIASPHDNSRSGQPLYALVWLESSVPCRSIRGPCICSYSVHHGQSSTDSSRVCPPRALRPLRSVPRLYLRSRRVSKAAR
jgi:hypothetical protein